MKPRFCYCHDCNRPARRTTGWEIYPHRPDLAGKYMWKCDGCGGHVGCHPNTDAPLGRIANKELRGAKMAAHSAFDPLWQRKMKRDGCSKKEARTAGYKWLAEQLQIDRKECHIGMMDVAQCRRVVEICTLATQPRAERAA